MGTLIRILIKNVNPDAITKRIKDFYSIGRNQIYGYEYKEAFLDKMNYTFIVFEAYFKDWVELTVHFYNDINEHNDFLKSISLDYQTRVIFGYEQTTTGDAKLTIWDKGCIIRSIYQKLDLKKNKIVLVENTGDQLLNETNFEYPEIGEDCDGFTMLDFDDIQTLFIDAGYIGESRAYEPERYTHLEYLK